MTKKGKKHTYPQYKIKYLLRKDMIFCSVTFVPTDKYVVRVDRK